MKVKDTLLKNGVISASAQSVTCPSCKCSGLYDPVKEEFEHFLYHDTPCLYINACRDMGIDPYSKESIKKAMDGVFTVKDLF